MDSATIPLMLICSKRILKKPVHQLSADEGILMMLKEEFAESKVDLEDTRASAIRRRGIPHDVEGEVVHHRCRLGRASENSPDGDGNLLQGASRLELR